MKQYGQKKHKSGRRQIKRGKSRTKNVGRSVKYTRKTGGIGGKQPGRAELVLNLGGKKFNFTSEKLAQVRQIRKAGRAVSVSPSGNGRDGS